MAAEAKNVEVTEAFIEAFSDVFLQTSKIELYVNIVNDIKLLTIFTESCILDF